ncbi:Cytochrome c oxidase subunit 6C [Acropora cervicornis]|uniref:Cytochrome c oxidase subunit 6C n=1 Tax=Acropora cervicornis TaxID=6130 RepID=A0AAD9V5V4_ACRCE|nr:Cytochrome c oxidase subunit 6C [Acropora cervicornis]
MAPPVLRGFVQRQLRNAILRSIAIGTAGGFVWMYGYAEPKRRKYEEFYKNYDAEKVAKEMEAEMEALE